MNIVCRYNNTLINNAVLADGTVRAVNDIVPEGTLMEVFELKRKGSSDADIIDCLRQRTVPTGYPYHTWIPGLLKPL